METSPICWILYLNEDTDLKSTIFSSGILRLKDSKKIIYSSLARDTIVFEVPGNKNLFGLLLSLNVKLIRRILKTSSAFEVHSLND